MLQERINPKTVINFFFIAFIIQGFLSVKNFGISYDELEYRQQGFVVLNDIAKRFFPEKTKLIKVLWLR